MSALLFHNARVLTMDPARPQAEAVAVRDGRIVAVGDDAEVSRALDMDAERIDCGGGALIPAFIDAHCHLLAYAASLRSVDCTDARSIADIQESVRRETAKRAPGEWVRAFGYEETALAEGRHPDRHDLDSASPGHPVRLIHRGGHASVLNSLALERAGIGIATEEPAGGFMGRDVTSGEPTGLLLGMERVIERAVPPLPYAELSEAVREASRRLLSAGVTCVQDATHTNGKAEWDLFERLIADGALPLAVVLMEGIEHLGEMPEQPDSGQLRRGPVKIMLHELADELSQDEAELVRMVDVVHAAGRQVAIHAVGEQAVAAATRALEAALHKRPRADHRHRIEHCSLLPEGMAERLARLGVVVVSQPSFVHERGERYLKLVAEERHPQLYAFRTLVGAGVALAGGSDAPVTRPEPLRALAAAVDRRSTAGRTVAPEQAVDADEALRWWTTGAARAAFLDGERGALRPGLQADIALLSSDPTSCAPDELRELSVAGVWQEGAPVALAGSVSLDHIAKHK